jgi:arylsulfatase A-like enzyme
VATRSIEFLRERDVDRPFFLYASFHRPHPPYDPPEWAFQQYIDQPMPDPPVGDWTDLWKQYEDSVSPESPVAQYDPRLLQRARAGYYGHMSHIDQQIERLLEELGAQGIRDNTVICFVSDHGELMGDHHLYRKSLPYEGSAHVPFAISGPGIPAGVRAEVVELRDVFPTLLDAAGVKVPETLDGRSVLPLARGEQIPWRAELHGEHTAFGQSIQWLTDGTEKYIWFSGTGAEQLFDLAADPQERHDLGRDPAATHRLARWRARMVDALADRPEGFVDGARLVAGRPVNEVLP